MNVELFLKCNKWIYIKFIIVIVFGVKRRGIELKVVIERVLNILNVNFLMNKMWL